MNTYRKPTRPQFPTTVVYALHSGDLRYRYIGTTANARMRLNEHRSRARRGHPAPVYQWMRTVGPENVSIVILDFHPQDALPVAEARWIAHLVSLGFDMLNQDGRDGTPYSKTERGMENLRIGQRGTPANVRPCIVDGVQYRSILEASRTLGIPYSTLRARLDSSETPSA